MGILRPFAGLCAAMRRRSRRAHRSGPGHRLRPQLPATRCPCPLSVDR